MKLFHPGKLQLRFQLAAENRLLRVLELCFGVVLFVIPLCFILVILLAG